MGDRVPGAWFAGAESAFTAIVLEDLRRRDGIEFCSFDRPFDADRMANVLEVLARLHAARWDDAELVANPYPDTLEFGMLDALLSEDNWNAQLSRPRGQRVPRELTDRGRVEKAWRELAAAKQTRPICLLHSDPHIGNTFFDRAGAGFFDWQLFTSGHWAYDVVWSMIGAMTVEGRRAHERDLLRHYLDALASHGVEAPNANSAWDSYRRFAIAGFLNFLTPGDTVQSEEYNSVVGERHATAAVDLETLALLGV
jgi:aminoglycoside/choline kinase family phosphotransferase